MLAAVSRQTRVNQPDEAALNELSLERRWVAPENNVSRRGHPYFSQLNRRAEASTPAPRGINARTPLAKPNDEPGVLWDAFRETPPPV